MSSFNQKLHEYRQGDWRSNFKHLDFHNVEAAVRKILTTKEGKKHYDRFGALEFTDPTHLVPLSLDEQIFRLLVLLDTQMDSEAQEVSANSVSNPVSSEAA